MIIRKLKKKKKILNSWGGISVFPWYSITSMNMWEVLSDSTCTVNLRIIYFTLRKCCNSENAIVGKGGADWLAFLSQ